MSDNVYQSYIIDHNHQVGQNDIDDIVKSGSSRLKSDGGPEIRRKVSMNWTGGLMEDNGGGDLVRTWRRLICQALAKAMSLILERQRFRR